MSSGEITIRVRYSETDRMGLLHHGHYLAYFEQGRTELLRAQGVSIRNLREHGYLLVLTRAQVRYRSPARYDDLLTLRTITERATDTELEHRYTLFREGQLLAEGETTMACVDREGRVQRLPLSLTREELTTDEHR
jgi:acyl-CoA thioester hydrolase